MFPSVDFINSPLLLNFSGESKTKRDKIEMFSKNERKVQQHQVNLLLLPEILIKCVYLTVFLICSPSFLPILAFRIPSSLKPGVILKSI